MLINADAGHIPLPDGSIHCALTSPPYFGQRRYPGAQECRWPFVSYVPMVGLPAVEVDGMACALGLEPTPADYVGHLVAVCREIWRVLRDDGVFWLNLGDAFASGKLSGQDFGRQGKSGIIDGTKNANMQGRAPIGNYGPGNLMMLPHRVALALQADGWVARNDLVWQKVAPMPESVAGWRWERCKIKIGVRERRHNPKDKGHAGRGTPSTGLHTPGWKARERDGLPLRGNEYSPCSGCRKCADNDGYVLKRGSWRHTRAHEFIFMCTKKMNYWANQEAVREAVNLDYLAKRWGGSLERVGPTGTDTIDRSQAIGKSHQVGVNPAGRNPRTVLTPKPSSYSGAHFATFPPSLIAPLIRASTPARCCPACGSGWSPVVERESFKRNELPQKHPHHRPNEYVYKQKGTYREMQSVEVSTTILGYRPTCTCHAPHDFRPLGQTSRDTGEDLLRCDRCGVANWTEPARRPCHEPGIVFDPFLGSGTTAMVARELGLRWIGTDLSFEYLDLQAKVRAKAGTPSNWKEGLPMFEEMSK